MEGIANSESEYNVTISLKSFVKDDQNKKKARRTFLMASRTEFLLCGLSSTVSPTYACTPTFDLGKKSQLSQIRNLRDYKSDLHIDTQVFISGSDRKCNDKSEPTQLTIMICCSRKY